MGKILRCVICCVVLLLLLTGFCGFAIAASGDTLVYVTYTGNKYHTSSCSYLRQSKVEITLQEAVKNGYTACSRCNPPVYDSNSSGLTREGNIAKIGQAAAASEVSPTPKPSQDIQQTDTQKENQNHWKTVALITWAVGGAAIFITPKIRKSKKSNDL